MVHSQEANVGRDRNSNAHPDTSRASISTRKPIANNTTIKLENEDPANHIPLEQKIHPATINLESLPQNTISRQVQEQLVALEALVGNVITAKQIQSASLYLDDLRTNNEQDEAKAVAWRLYIDSDKVDTERMWWDLDFWRLMREVPTAVVDFDEIRERYLRDQLLLLAQRWVSLAASGGLGELEQCQEVRAVKEKGGAPAEILKAFLESFKRRKGFERWTRDRMSDARMEVIKVWNKCQLKRPLNSKGIISYASRQSSPKLIVSQSDVEISAARRVKLEDESTASSKNPTLVKSQRAERAVSDLYGPD
jgi:hypothetical protein